MLDEAARNRIRIYGGHPPPMPAMPPVQPERPSPAVTNGMQPATPSMPSAAPNSNDYYANLRKEYPRIHAIRDFGNKAVNAVGNYLPSVPYGRALAGQALTGLGAYAGNTLGTAIGGPAGGIIGGALGGGLGGAAFLGSPNPVLDTAYGAFTGGTGSFHNTPYMRNMWGQMGNDIRNGFNVFRNDLGHAWNQIFVPPHPPGFPPWFNGPFR